MNIVETRMLNKPAVIALICSYHAAIISSAADEKKNYPITAVITVCHHISYPFGITMPLSTRARNLNNKCTIMISDL